MRPELIKEWIDKADEDFGFAFTNLQHTEYFSQICFHFQQAVEKYLKAFLVANELPFRPVHSLMELLENCKQKEPRIGELEEACRYLNPFFIDTHYPVHWPTHYNKETAIQAKNAAEEVKKWIMTSMAI